MRGRKASRAFGEGGREGDVDGKEEPPLLWSGREGRGVDGETRETFARGGGRDVRETVEVSSGNCRAVVAKRGGVFVVYASSNWVQVANAAHRAKGGDGLQAVMERDWQGLLTNMVFLSQESPRRW